MTVDYVVDFYDQNKKLPPKNRPNKYAKRSSSKKKKNKITPITRHLKAIQYDQHTENWGETMYDTNAELCANRGVRCQ